MKTDLIREALKEYWGEPCVDYEPECACCKAWRQFEKLKDKAKKGKQQ